MAIGDAENEGTLTGVERTFDRQDFIVSKTDLKGRITYGNRLFTDLSGYDYKTLIGAPHSLIRHPHMPRCIFKLMWDTIEARKEIFAYVVNRCANGDHYWVEAHVTPTHNEQGAVNGYHSNRRVANPAVLQDTIVPLYKGLLDIESGAPNRKEGMKRGFAALQEILKKKGMAYDEFFFSLAG